MKDTLIRIPVQEPTLFAQDAQARVSQIPVYQFELPVTADDLAGATPQANPLVGALRRAGARNVSYQSRIVRFDLDGAVPWRDVADHLGWQNVLRYAGVRGLLNGQVLTAGIKAISWSGFVDEPTYAALLSWTQGVMPAPFTARFKTQALEIDA